MDLFLRMEEELIVVVVARDLSKTDHEENSVTSGDTAEKENEKEATSHQATKIEGSTESTSDSRITFLEKTIEKIQETQSDMQKKLE